MSDVGQGYQRHEEQGVESDGGQRVDGNTVELYGAQVVAPSPHADDDGDEAEVYEKPQKARRRSVSAHSGVDEQSYQEKEVDQRPVDSGERGSYISSVSLSFVLQSRVVYPLLVAACTDVTVRAAKSGGEY